MAAIKKVQPDVTCCNRRGARPSATAAFTGNLTGVIGLTSTKPTAWYVTHFGAYFCAALKFTCKSRFRWPHGGSRGQPGPEDPGSGILLVCWQGSRRWPTVTRTVTRGGSGHGPHWLRRRFGGLTRPETSQHCLWFCQVASQTVSLFTRLLRTRKVRRRRPARGSLRSQTMRFKISFKR